MPRPFLTAEWRWLAMLNFRADPEQLKPCVPAGTELDAWRGETLVSIVGFQFLNTRLSGVAIPWHHNFDEVNLRFYVRREVGGEVRRGVTFLRELVPRRAIAWLARAMYNEPYAACPMRSETGQCCRYSWRIGGRWHSLEVRPRGNPAPLEEGSQEEFVAGRYWGYTRQRGGRTIEYRVEHPRWRVWQTAEARLDCDVAAVYGTRFAGVLNQQPCSAFLADGSPVTVYRPVWLP